MDDLLKAISDNNVCDEGEETPADMLSNLYVKLNKFYRPGSRHKTS